MVDRSAAHLAATLAGELSVPPTDVVAVASASVLTALRTSLLGQARRDSLDGQPVDTVAARLAAATNRAFGLLERQSWLRWVPRPGTSERQAEQRAGAGSRATSMRWRQPGWHRAASSQAAPSAGADASQHETIRAGVRLVQELAVSPRPRRGRPRTSRVNSAAS